MKSLSALVAVLLMASVPARADPPKAAVFDFELVDTSLQGEVDGPRADEQRRLMSTGDRLRMALAKSEKFAILDTAAHGSNLQSCGGCDAHYAQQIGADFAITGVVQKVSNLILNMNVYIRDAHTGQHVDERRLSRQYR
jgi:hypothetical protein